MRRIDEPLKCPKCGNDDQDKFIAMPSDSPTKRNIETRALVVLRGWQCTICKALAPE